MRRWADRLLYYKQHFVCFQCRKMIRKPPAADRPKLNTAPNNDWCPNCPDCGRPLYLMGKAFAPPKRNQVKEWKAIEQTYEQWIRKTAASTYMRQLKKGSNHDNDD